MGVTWLTEVADLELRYPVKDCLVNPKMEMTLLSEGYMTIHQGWETKRGAYGTMVTAPDGHRDLAYRRRLPLCITCIACEITLNSCLLSK